MLVNWRLDESNLLKWISQAEFCQSKVCLTIFLYDVIFLSYNANVAIHQQATWQ